MPPRPPQNFPSRILLCPPPPPTRKLAARSLASVLLGPVLVLLEGVTRSFLKQRLVSEPTETGQPNRSFRNRMKCCVYIYIYIYLPTYRTHMVGWENRHLHMQSLFCYSDRYLGWCTIHCQRLMLSEKVKDDYLLSSVWYEELAFGW